MSDELEAPTGEGLNRKQVVSALKTTADVLELLNEEPFRVNAFRSAARSLEGHDAPFEDVVAAGFRGVPKIGQALSADLRVLAQTGTFPPLEAAAEQVPPGVMTLFRVRGIGPKKIRALWEAGVTSLEELREACRAGSVAKLKGFGARSQDTILEAVEFALRVQGRQYLSTAWEVAVTLAAALSDLEPRVAGALRRGMETVSDVDLTVTGEAQEVRARLEGLLTDVQPADEYAVWQGRLNGVPVTVGYAVPGRRGALDLMSGGGALRDRAVAAAAERGLELSGSGLRENGNLLDTPNEADLLARLGLPALPAEYREAEHLQRGTDDLPPEEALIRVEDVRGLLHVHSVWSDGAATVREMTEEGLRLGFAYLGTGDHSGNAHYANGLSVERLRAYVREVRELRAAGLPVLAGAEVDILEDGTLDYPDEELLTLDYVVASVHSHFTLSAERQTERLVRAVSHPLVTILGHATGRLLLRRPPYPVNLDDVMQAAATNRTVVEINANAYRLDVDWRTALAWRDRVLFAVNTDAHVPAGLRDVRYGVMQARKAGLTPRHVVNCLDLEGFVAFVREQRAGRGV